MQLRGVLFPARIHGFILGHLNAVDLVREVLVCVPAGEMIAFAHGSFAELHRGAGAIPLSFIFRAAIGHIGESITCTPTVATIPSMAAVSVGTSRYKASCQSRHPQWYRAAGPMCRRYSRYRLSCRWECRRHPSVPLPSCRRMSICLSAVEPSAQVPLAIRKVTIAVVATSFVQMPFNTTSVLGIVRMPLSITAPAVSVVQPENTKPAVWGALQSRHWLHTKSPPLPVQLEPHPGLSPHTGMLLYAVLVYNKHRAVSAFQRFQQYQTICSSHYLHQIHILHLMYLPRQVSDRQTPVKSIRTVVFALAKPPWP